MATTDIISRTAAWYFLPYILFNHVALALIAIDQGAGRFRMNGEILTNAQSAEADRFAAAAGMPDLLDRARNDGRISRAR